LTKTLLQQKQPSTMGISMSKSVALLLVLVFLTASCLIAAKPAFSSADIAEDSWASKAPMHEARGCVGIAVVNGKIYAIGGSNEKGEWDISGATATTGGVVGTNEEYDPATDTWIIKTPMPTPRIGFSIVIFQNKIYCIGGKTESSTGANEVYDPATNSWETKTPLPTRREGFAILVYQNKIYFIGGTTGRNYTTGLAVYTGVNEIYDPATDTWETKAPLPTELRWTTANVVNGKLYVIVYSLNYVYDPATDTWTTKAPMPNGAYGGASAVLNNKMYVMTTINQIYDPETDKWRIGAPPPSGRIDRILATTGEMAPKRIYVLNDETLRVYNPETDSWTFGAHLPTSRLKYGVALIDDLLYTIGGNTYTYEHLFSLTLGGSVTPYATNEQYTPFGYGTIPPVVSVLSPENNKTYTVSNASLTLTVNRPVVWLGYSLDGQENVTITGNITITGLTSGLHNITVYAKDEFENMGASETVNFTIAKESEESFPMCLAVAVAIVVAAVVLVAAVGVGLSVYLKKRK
jgi:hypothetical protein